MWVILVALLNLHEYVKLKINILAPQNQRFFRVMQYSTARTCQDVWKTKIWCDATGGVCNEVQLYLMPDGLCVREAYVTRIDGQFLSSGRGTIQ